MMSAPAVYLLGRPYGIDAAMTYSGTCHCGDLAVTFDSSKSAQELPVRQCSCGFCRRHNPRYTADRDGQVVLRWRREPTRYRFGHGTADFVMCARCGVFALAAWRHEERWYAVLNTLILDQRDDFTAPARLMDFGAETPAVRAARRAASWIPAQLLASP